jgi:predicted DNA-binding protein (MmcQ/YjbR family)
MVRYNIDAFPYSLSLRKSLTTGYGGVRSMALEWVRTICKALPHTTEEVLWGGDLVFKTGGKMYCVTPLEPGGLSLTFKVPVEEFAELCERDGVIPAPYMARHHWVALEREGALPRAETRQRIRTSYDLVRAKLPKKVQASLK